MTKFSATVIVLASFLALALAENEKSQTVESKVVDNIEEYRLQHPEERIIRLNPILDEKSTTIIYVHGRRVPGDRIIATRSENINFVRTADFNYDLWYPQSGGNSENVITLVEMALNYGSKIGNAYIVDGGIRHRRIKILIEAKQAQYFQLQAALYGYPVLN